jgi:hypothetical protein
MTTALLLIASAWAASTGVDRDKLSDRLVELNTSSGGSLIVAGNWETYHDVKKAADATNLDLRVERVSDAVGDARALLEKELDKDKVKCALLISVHNDAQFAVLELGTCTPPAAEPGDPTVAPVASAPAPAPAP